MADMYAPCPECHGLNYNHKFSCSRAEGKSGAVAEYYDGGNDWRNYRSTGNVAALYYAGKPSYFDTDLVSHVVDNLYQGGCQNGVVLGSDFSTVVSLYPWERYTINDDVTRVEVKMFDSSEGVVFEDLVTASDAVLDGLKKGATLVHCQAGLNRSGLVAAFTLMRLGYYAQDAIDLLRKSRSPFVLCNGSFVKQLHELQHTFENDPDFAEVFRA